MKHISYQQGIQYIFYAVMAFVLWKYGKVIIVSFIMAWLFYPMIEKVCHFFHCYHPFLKKGMMFFIMGGVFLICLVGVGIFVFIFLQVLQTLPQIIDDLYQQCLTHRYLVSWFMSIYDSLQSTLQNMIQTVVTGVISLIYNMTSFIGYCLLSFFFTLLFLFYYPTVEAILFLQPKIYRISQTIKTVIYYMMKTYLVLSVVTFIILVVGFLLLRLEHPFLYAFFIAVFDFFPILGIEMILIPWMIICALLNQISTAVLLFVIYVMIVISKNIIESHMLSHMIGISPLLMFMMMYLLMKIWGIKGMLMVPIVILMIDIYKIERKQKSG